MNYRIGIIENNLADFYTTIECTSSYIRQASRELEVAGQSDAAFECPSPNEGEAVREMEAAGQPGAAEEC